MPNCKHGIDQQHCAICLMESGTMRRQFRGGANATGNNLGYNSPVIYPRRPGGRLHPSFQFLGERTIGVHIVGDLFLWALKLILERAPNLKTIQVIPKMHGRLRSCHKELCVTSGVEIVAGHFRPERAWADGENHSTSFKDQRQFFLGLKGEQKKLFEELLELGFEAALITARYFCLGEEDFVPQGDLALEFGFTHSGRAGNISIKINAVLHYLGSPFKTGRISERAAQTIKKQVLAIRRAFEDNGEREEFLAALEVISPPKGLPYEKLVTYFRLLKAQKDGRLGSLKKSDPRLHQVLMLSFGLDGPGRYRTTEEVAALADGVNSRERTWELRRIALGKLGIGWV